VTLQARHTHVRNYRWNLRLGHHTHFVYAVTANILRLVQARHTNSCSYRGNLTNMCVCVCVSYFRSGARS
jgi:hypothetical protein